MAGTIHAAQRAIDDEYNRTKGPVAFLDESYQAPADMMHHGSFYLFTAVLVGVKDMVTVRSGLNEIAGSSHWHTRDALQTDDGRTLTREMLDYLAEGVEPCVVTHRVGVDALEAAFTDTPNETSTGLQPWSEEHVDHAKQPCIEAEAQSFASCQLLTLPVSRPVPVPHIR